MGAYKRKLTPSDPDAIRAIFALNGVPCIGFISHKEKTIEFMTMFHFEYLMDFYMQNYLSQQTKQ
jgi:hypothetical protein